ncbi:DUF4157 domain-containing protein [Kitasatospora purpeofusca]|uniref:eCIS core domain-containing protein n=1 Tax=Kitasatospora purpeofusca TaxID=67352 RepID=UPI0033FE74B9
MHANDSARSNEAEAQRPPARTAGTTPLPPLLALQRSVGNAAVVHMLRRAGRTGAQQEPRHSVGRGRQQPEQGEQPVQRSTVPDVLRSPGRPLDDSTRTEMEARLGADFSDVRLHTDTVAQASAAEVGARAYTSGNHVVIGNGGGDRHTLAHELAHVVQQRKGQVAGTDNGDGLKVSDPADRFEREAEATARRVMSEPVSAHRHTGAPAAESASHNDGHAVQRQIYFESNPVGNILEFQHNTSVRPDWEGDAATMAANAAAQQQSLNHVIPFERIEYDLTKHLNFLLDNRGTAAWQGRVADFETNCDALFTNGTPEHTEMVRRRDIVKNLVSAVPQNPGGPQRAPVTTAARKLLSSLNSSSQNLRAGNSSLNSSISNAIDAEFRTGTFWYSGPVVTGKAPPAGGNPPAGAARITGPTGAQGNRTVTDLECVRLTPQHESHVYAYIDASPSSFHFVLSGGAGALHPLARPGQQMSSTQAPTAVALPSSPHPVIVMDPNNTKAPHLFFG